MKYSRFTLRKGDNGFWIIEDKGKYFLAMKYRDEASVVVNRLNVNEIALKGLQQMYSEIKDERDSLQYQLWKLRQQLKDNDIKEDIQ